MTQHQHNKPEGTLTYEEVGQKLGGLSTATVKLRIREAGLRPIRPGRTPFLDEKDFPRLLESTKQRGPDPNKIRRSVSQAIDHRATRDRKRYRDRTLAKGKPEPASRMPN